MEFVCENLSPKIKRLSLAGCQTRLSNESLLKLVRRCNNIQELDLSDAHSFNDKAIAIIIEHLGDGLAKLSLSRCFDIHPARLLDLAAMGQQFRYLNIYGTVQDYKLDIIRKQLPRLSINETPWCSIARSASGDKRNVLWNIKLWN